MVEQMLWLPLFNQLNAFRKDVLGLPTIHLGKGGTLITSFFLRKLKKNYKVAKCCMKGGFLSCTVSAKLLYLNLLTGLIG